MNRSSTPFLSTLFLMASFVMGVAGCGSDGTTQGSGLVGTWDAVSTEANEMSVSCPGELELPGPDMPTLSCGTVSITFNDDGAYVTVETTDALGAPFDWREEGMWSTSGSDLTLVCMLEGPTEDELRPCDDSEPETVTWSISGSTLRISRVADDEASTMVTGILERR